ncbi:MAG: LysM peptidoglycan-binding domain-containing protein, partial [Desulfobacterales bacterium]
MKHKAGLIGVILVMALAVGCAGPGKKSPAQLAEEYTVKAKAYEAQGDKVEALEQYKLVLTVDPENQMAKEKSAILGQELRAMAEAHYRVGLKFYNQGRYRQARKEFLTALRYNPEHLEAKNKLTATKKEIEQVTRYIVHTLQPNETISTLADKYYGDYRKFHLIAEYNELEDATKVTVGQEIKIPVLEGMPIMADPAAIKTDSGDAPEAMAGEIITVKRFITHRVQPGETLSRLAQMYYGDLMKYPIISKFNNLEDGVSVRVGQELKIPEVEGLPFLAPGKAGAAEVVSTPPEMPAAKVDSTPPKVPAAEVASIPPQMPATEKEAKKPQKKAADKEPAKIEDQVENYRELG